MTNDRPAAASPNPGEATAGRAFLSGRTALVLLVTALVMVSLVGPVKGLLDQRARIDELASQQSDNLAVIAELEKQTERWQDPAYVRAQVRERLHYVLPNETGYIVYESQKLPAAVSYRLGSTGQADAWFTTMFKSLRDAAGTASGAESDD